MRILYMSSPDFGVPTLQQLAAVGYEMAGVVCQPDRPAGRGLKMAAPPVKQAALALGVPVYQPTSLRTPETLAALRGRARSAGGGGLWQPHPRRHLRPGRGRQPEPAPLAAAALARASPVAAAILAGDAETGATVHFVTAELDAGDILAQRRVPIESHDTTGTLTRLAEVGAALMVETVAGWLGGQISPWQQDANQVLWCGRMAKEEGRIDWTEGAAAIARRVRAFQPWPGAFTAWDGQQLGVIAAEPLADWVGEAAPGQVLCEAGRVLVATGAGGAAAGHDPACRPAAPGRRAIRARGTRVLWGALGLDSPRGMC